MLENVILSIGTNRFSKCLFDLLGRELSAQHLTMCRYIGERPVNWIACESLVNSRAFRVGLEDYAKKLYHGDPFRASFYPSTENESTLLTARTDQVLDNAVKKRLFGTMEIEAKMSLVIRRPDDAITVTIYRALQYGVFGERELAWMQFWSPMLTTAVRRHLELCNPPAFIDTNVLKQLLLKMPTRSALSLQEAAVCAYIIVGHSTERIALALDISRHSVTTYRRRAYCKLNLSTENELMRLLWRLQSGASEDRVVG